MTVRPQRRRQRGDEQPVVAPGEHAADGARRVSAQPVGDEPLVGQQPRGVASPSAAEHGDADAAAPSRASSDAASSTADSAGSRQPASVSGASTPPPP